MQRPTIWAVSSLSKLSNLVEIIIERLPEVKIIPKPSKKRQSIERVANVG